MKTFICCFCTIILLVIPISTIAEEPMQYESSKDIVLDSCLEISYEQVSALARAWKDPERLMELYDQELSDSYNDNDIQHPYKVYIFYPTDSFDPLFLYKQVVADSSTIMPSEIAWQSIWNVNIINETNQSRISVKYLAESMSMITCVNINELKNTCYVAYQLSESSPCYVSTLHAIDSKTAIVYTTAIWVNHSAMNNLQTLVYTLKMKYGSEAFKVFDATSNYY